MKKKYSVNEKAFSGRINEKKAYWIGFLAADGYIGKDKRLQLKLKKDDYKHIEKFKDFLEYNGIIEYRTSQLGKNIRKHGLKEYYEIALLRVSNKNIWKDLEKYGIINNKSLILEFPSNIPENMLRHYIRGYIDGDGCWSSDNKKYPTMTLTIVSTKNFLFTINQIFLKYNLVKQFNKIQQPSKIYALPFGGNKQIKKIARWLYKDSIIFLDRKKKHLIDHNIIDSDGNPIIKIIDKNGSNNSNAKKYQIISPENKKYIVHGELRKFCKEKKLWFKGILDVRFKRRDNYKGWKCNLIT